MDGRPSTTPPDEVEDDDAPGRVGPSPALRVVAVILLLGFLLSAVGGLALLRP